MMKLLVFLRGPCSRQPLFLAAGLTFSIAQMLGSASEPDEVPKPDKSNANLTSYTIIAGGGAICAPGPSVVLPECRLEKSQHHSDFTR